MCFLSTTFQNAPAHPPPPPPILFDQSLNLMNAKNLFQNLMGVCCGIGLHLSGSLLLALFVSKSVILAK